MRVLILVSLVLGAATSLPAQRQVRWNSLDGVRQGRVESVDSTGRLVVQYANGAGSLTLNPDTLPSLHYRTGGNSRNTNALIGAAVGAVIGGVAGYASGDDRCGTGWLGCLFTYTAEQKAGMGAGLGAMLGLVIGGIAVPAARWVPWEKGALVARIRPIGGRNVTGDPMLGLRVSL